MAIAWDALTLVMRVLAVVMMVLVTVELTWALDKGEILVQRLRDVFLAWAAVIMFPLLAALDRLVDITPGVDLRPILENLVWSAYTILVICSVRLWLELRLAYRRKRAKFKD